MKTQTKRKLITICLVLFIATTIVLTILFSDIGDAAAADMPVTMKVEFSDSLGGKKLAKGGTFTLTMTVTYLGADAADTTWSSIDLTFGPLLPDGTGFDKAIAKKLTLTPFVDEVDEKNPQDFVAKTNLYFSTKGGYSDSGSESFLDGNTASLNAGAIRMAISSEDAGGTVSAKKQKRANEPATFDFVFTAAEDIEAESITFGFWKVPNAQGQYTPTNNVSMGTDKMSHSIMPGEKTKGKIDAGQWTIDIMSEEDDNTIAELEMGPSATELSPVDLTAPLQYVINGPDDKIFVKPTLSNENATAKVGVSDGTPTYVPTDNIASGEVRQLPVPDGNGKIVLVVTSPSGIEETYEIEVIISYVRLGALAIDAGDPTLTTLGLKGEFDKDTFLYDANVKPNSTIQMTATVLSGYGISDTLAITGNDCTVDATATSGTAFSVASIVNGASVVITATAADGVTKQAYTITFIALSDDATIKGFTVAGAVQTYNSDATKATENSVDYFFYLMDESVFEGAMKIVVAEGASIEVDGVAYDENKMQPLGTYTIRVIAAAGNDATYKAILSAPEMLQFVFDCGYQFIFEEDVDSFTYRRTYGEKGMVHGVDDLDFERFILGQIEPMTTINMFLGQIKDNLLSLVKIYTDVGNLVYDRGNLTADYAENADSPLYAVATGWRIDFGAGDTPTETIYLSILGDVDGNGLIDSADNTRMNQHISERVPFATAEFRLAAYVSNVGSIGATDNTEISKIIKEKSFVTDYYWFPEE